MRACQIRHEAAVHPRSTARAWRGGASPLSALGTRRCQPAPDDSDFMVQATPLTRPAFHVAKQLSCPALRDRRWRAPIGARPRAHANDAGGIRALDEQQKLGLTLATADEELQRVSRRRAAEVERGHRVSSRSATMAPKSSARYSRENL